MDRTASAERQASPVDTTSDVVTPEEKLICLGSWLERTTLKEAQAAQARRKVREKRGESVWQEEQSYDTVYTPGSMTGMAVRGPTSPLSLLVTLRDEAHRFAVTYHRKLRSKKTIKTALTDVPGVGPATARKLLEAFGSVAKIRAASAEKLVEAGATRRAADAIKERL